MIDSPGIRELGLWHLSRRNITQGFAEVAALAQRCQFRNCAHEGSSKGCAVQAGVKAGLVHRSRLQHYHMFLQ